MTREEAITLIKPIMLMMKNPQGEVISDGYYALEMAIQALEQEPYEDCVSRLNAIAAIRNLYPDIPVIDIMGARRKWQDKYSQYIECEKEIERLPSVQPKSNTGHWIMHDNHRECSKCGVWLIKDMPRNSYCPNCGARMESEVEHGID